MATHPHSLDHRYNLELFLGGTPESVVAAYQSASSASLVTPRAPPTLILHGALDINVFLEQAHILDRNPLKSRRDDLIIAQGKRGTSAALGNAPPKYFSLSPRGTSGESD